MPTIGLAGLADASEEVFPTIPTGIYECRCKTLESVDSKSREGRQNLKASCVVGPTHTDVAGTNLNVYLPLPASDMDPVELQRSLSRIQRFHIACGVEISGDDIDTDAFFGAELKLSITEAEVTNKETGLKEKSNNVKDYLPL